MSEIRGVEVKEWVLSNGLTVWVVQDNEASKVYGSIVVKAGAKHSPNTGIAHYFEHIMFKGTDKIGTHNYAQEKPLLEQIATLYATLKKATDEEERRAIQKEINELSQAAAVWAIPNDFNNLIHQYGGSGLNAATSYDYTLYYNHFSPEYLEHWCELNSERLIAPVFRLFQSELETVYEEKNMYENQMESQAQQALFARIMAPHPYQYPIIGSTEHLKNPDLHGMQAFFEQYYVAGNMGLILSGPLELTELKELLERTFGKITPGVVKEEPTLINKAFEGKEQFDIKLPIPMMKASGKLWNTVANKDQDTLPLTLLTALFNNSGKTGLFDQLTLKGKVLMASALHFQLNDTGFWGYMVLPAKGFQSNRNAQKLLDIEIEKVKDGTIDPDRFELVKQGLLREYMKVLEETKERHALLQVLFAEGGKPSDLLNDIRRLEELSLVDITRVANKYLSKNYLLVTKKTGRYPKDMVTKPDFEALQNNPDKGISPFAYYLTQLPLKTYPIKFIDFDKDAERVTMDKKLRLFRVENKVNDLYSLDFIFYRSTRLHPEQKPLASYLELVGADGIRAEEFNEALQRYGASVTFEANDYFFLVSLIGIEHYLDEALTLLQRLFLAPNEQPKTLKQIERANLLRNKAVKSNPTELSRRLAQWVRYGMDAPYLSELTCKELKRVRVPQLIKDWQQVQKYELDIHYTGRRPIVEVQELLQNRLTLSTERIAWEGFSDPKLLQQPKEQLFFLNDPKSTQAIITIYYNLGPLSKEMYQAATLYNHYLGGGMGSLLFQEVREYRSLAYGVGSQLLHPAPIYTEASTCLLIQMSTQADKAFEAWRLLKDLVKVVPDDKERIQRSRQSIRSGAVTAYPKMRLRSRSIVSYERQGYAKDPKLEQIAISDEFPDVLLSEFHKHYILPAIATTTLLGSSKNIDLSEFKKEITFKKVKKSLLLL